MNMPKRASCHHFMRASRSASPAAAAARGEAAASAAPAAIQLRQSRLVMGCAPEGTGYHAVRLPGEVRNAGFSLRINGKKAVLMPVEAPKDNPSGVEKDRASFAIAPRGNLSYIGAGVMAIMAFCSTCGANMTGAFCAKCGTPAGVAQARAPMAPVGGAGRSGGDTPEIQSP